MNFFEVCFGYMCVGHKCVLGTSVSQVQVCVRYKCV